MRTVFKFSALLVMLALSWDYSVAQEKGGNSNVQADSLSVAQDIPENTVVSDTTSDLGLFLTAALRNNPRIQAAREKARTLKQA